ncbi:MAG: hypothetical protein DMG01_24410 [Acidobacteria bacterium]|nr:MAG: hypothetical protein DMG01_24410 [Acidobacteriota bacterium]
MMLMNRLAWIKSLADYLGGAEDLPPAGLSLPASSSWWGLWWGALTIVIVLFCGQASKFIYIDF